MLLYSNDFVYTQTSQVIGRYPGVQNYTHEKGYFSRIQVASNRFVNAVNRNDKVAEELAFAEYQMVVSMKSSEGK